MNICKQSISYLKNADKDTLRQLFYRAKQQFYDSKQVLFDVGDACENIFFVLHGVIDIVLSDGYQNHQVLDILGKGSIIGANFVLKKEKWVYSAINNTTMTVRVLKISHNLLQTLAAQSLRIQNAVHQ